MMKAKRADVALIKKNVALVRKWNATLGAEAPTPNIGARCKPERAADIEAARALWSEFTTGTPLAGVPYDRAYRAGMQAGIWPRRRAYYERRHNGERPVAAVDVPEALPIALKIAGIGEAPAPAQSILPLDPPPQVPARPAAREVNLDVVEAARKILDLPLPAGQRVALLRSLVSTPAA